MRQSEEPVLDYDDAVCLADQDVDAVFAPLRASDPDQSVVIGQIGQSLDGRIATTTGESKYINCPEGMTHLHRLRAHCNAVVVGVGTAICDDPLLTVRLINGSNPARIVIDPSGRLPVDAKLLCDDGTRRLVITSPKTELDLPDGVEVIRIEPRTDDEPCLHPADIVAALAKKGLNRVLIEGGAHTVSLFLAAGCLTRLHVTVAPIILGGGKAGFAVDGIDQLSQAIRPDVHVFQLGKDILFDCDVSNCASSAGA